MLAVKAMVAENKVLVPVAFFNGILKEFKVGTLRVPPPIPIKEEKAAIKKPMTERTILVSGISLCKGEKCRLKNILIAIKLQNRAKDTVTKFDFTDVLRRAPQMAPIIKEGSHLRKMPISTSLYLCLI